MKRLDAGDQVLGVGRDPFEDQGVGPELEAALLDEGVVLGVGAQAAEAADQRRATG